MGRVTLAELAKSTGGQWLVEPADLGQDVGQPTTDPTACGPDAPWWALGCAPQQAAEPLRLAAEHQAAGAVVPRGVAPAATRGLGWALAVDDPQAALSTVATWHRRRMAGHVVAVAGGGNLLATSVLVDAIARRSLHGTLAPLRTEPRALALAMLGWDAGADYFVVPVGHPARDREAAPLDLLAPQVGVFLAGETPSAAEHAPAWQALFAALPADGLAIVQADDPLLRTLVPKCPATVCRIGQSSDADFMATDTNCSGDRLRLRVHGHRLELPGWGTQSAMGVLAAVALARLWCVPWAEIQAALAELDSATDVLHVRGTRDAAVRQLLGTIADTAEQAAADDLAALEPKTAARAA